MDFRGRTALITGASSGIGAAFARELASRGADVVLVARRQDRLVGLAAELEGDHGITAYVVPVDLSSEGAAVAIRRATDAFGVRIDTLVNNAGFGTYGPYETIDPLLDHALAMVQVVAIVDLTHAYLPDMVQAGDGAVINVASGASFQPMPYQAVYGAVKAFLLSFNDALWFENRTRGVRFVACCPGATDTEYFEVLGNAEEAQFGPRRPVSGVVRDTLRALDRGRPVVSIGWRWKLTAMLPRLLPRRTAVGVAGRAAAPRELQMQEAVPHSGRT